MARAALSGPGTAGDGARFPALQHRHFRRYVAGQGLSLVGFWMQTVAQGWLVYRLSGSELALGVVGFATYLPVLLLAPVAGGVADRLDKRRLVIATQSLAMLAALALGALTATDRATVPLVAATAALAGAVTAFDLPARQSFLVEMVGPADLPSAIAVNASVFNTARVLGPAIAGVMVATVGEAPCFVANGVSYLALILVLVTFPAGRRPTRGAPRAAIRAGLAYVRREPEQRALLVALGLVAGVALQSNVLMPSLAERTFDAGPGGYGLLLTAYGGGAVLSALNLASRRHTLDAHRRHLLRGLGVSAAAIAGVALSPTFELAVGCQLVAGLGMVRYTATTNTLIQSLVDDAFRGRIMGLHTVMFMGTAPLGNLVLGALAVPAGPRPALLVAAAVSLGTLWWLRGRLRRSPRFSRDEASGIRN